MSANSFGQIFRIHSFGESHGTGLGVIVDGCPAGVKFDESILLREVKRRRPGQWQNSSNRFISERREDDIPEVLSGVFEGKTLGTPIAMLVRNHDQRSSDYSKKMQRRGHADDVWKSKFGHSDFRGGGRSSGRETVARVLGGAVARMLLKQVMPRFQVTGYLSTIGEEQLSESDETKFLNAKKSSDLYTARFPSPARQRYLAKQLQEAQNQGESFGAMVSISIRGLTANLGQPVFNKLKSDLAKAMLSVGATVGVEFGAGFAAPTQRGTKFHRTSESVYGGIRGGISTGENITMRVAIKPTSSILDVAKKGRHDPCIGIRAVPVLEAMAALVIADHYLWKRLDRV